MTVPGPPNRCRLTAPVDLLPGDEITETGTPDGPTYVVARVDPGRGLLVLDEGVEVPLGPSSGRVLARRLRRRA